MALSDATRQEIVDLIKAGGGRNEVAREVGVSGRTVSVVAEKAGLTFDRTQTRKATEARLVDAKARRATLGLEMLGDLEEARLRLAEATGARDFQLTAQGLDALTRAYSNMLKLDLGDGGMEEARGLLGTIIGAIKLSAEGQPLMNPTVDEETGEVIPAGTLRAV